MDILTFEQIRLIFIVYISSIVPLFVIPILYNKGRIPTWVPYVYFFVFIICAIGWELWFTYGWIDGYSVNLRRAEVLSKAIPININWFLNSLADSGTVCLGSLYISWILFKKDNSIFHKWNWNCFFILLILALLQNIFVEMFLYHDQLSVDKPISWAPMSPFGPWINPVLFTFQDRTIYLQNQMPWLIMTPIYYRIVILFNSKIK